MRLPRLIGIAGLAFAAPAAIADEARTGPSSSQSPYVVPTTDGGRTTAILTVGDAVGTKPDGSPYRLVGIPDGLGAYDNGDGTFTLLANHELNAAAGVPRLHGAAGAFVSKWVIRRWDLKVLEGADLIRRVALWDTSLGRYAEPSAGVTIGRLCSADLAASAAFWNRRTGKGTRARVFLSGEEVGDEGRLFAHLPNGTSYQLPDLGRLSWENAVANPDSGDTTLVAGLDDSTPGQVYMYVGTKARTGSTVERTGLRSGLLYGIRVAGLPLEQDSSAVAPGTSFDLVPVDGDGLVANMTGAAVQAASRAAGVTEFLRPEDGAWDPDSPNDFYFATTNRIDGPSRLYRLRFRDVRRPLLGGTITAVLDGTEGPRMMDNLTVDDGRVLIQEDPGSGSPVGTDNYIAKIWEYDIDNDRVLVVATLDPARFTPGSAAFLTNDEESSGVIPAPFLGRDAFLVDVQAHYASPDPELFQGGQILALHLRRSRSHR